MRNLSNPLRLTAAVPVALCVMALSATGASADATPDDAACAATPTPAGCISSINYADPDSVSAVSSANGEIEGAWDPNAIGTVVQLDTPVPMEEAQQIAADNADDYGLDINDAAAQTRSVGRKGGKRSKRGARATTRVSYPGLCDYDIRAPRFDDIAKSLLRNVVVVSIQQCGRDITQNGIDIGVGRDIRLQTAAANDGPGYQRVVASSSKLCHPAASHTWYNFTSLWCSYGGRLNQGPAGFFKGRDAHCY